MNRINTAACRLASIPCHLGERGLIGRIKLRWVLRKWDVGVCTGSSWLRIGTGGGRL